MTAARDILDRNGLKRISSPPETRALDLQKLSTDELVVLDAITRKARGQPIMELAAARLVIRELACKLARRKQKQMV